MKFLHSPRFVGGQADPIDEYPQQTKIDFMRKKKYSWDRRIMASGGESERRRMKANTGKNNEKLETDIS